MSMAGGEHAYLEIARNLLYPDALSAETRADDIQATNKGSQS
jgi:hypothetical protein